MPPLLDKTGRPILGKNVGTKVYNLTADKITIGADNVGICFQIGNEATRLSPDQAIGLALEVLKNCGVSIMQGPGKTIVKG